MMLYQVLLLVDAELQKLVDGCRIVAENVENLFCVKLDGFAVGTL